MLGDLLANLTDETTATETLLRGGDLQMLAAARQRAATEGLPLAAYVTRTVQRYATAASDEEWITLIGLLNRSPDPAMTCLQRAFTYALHEVS